MKTDQQGKPLFAFVFCLHMKYTLFSIVSAIALCSTAFADKEPKDSEISLDLLISTLCQKFPDKIIGWEEIYGCNSIIKSPSLIDSAISKPDLESISKIVFTETDYECLLSEESIVFIPKDNQAIHETALSKREVKYPDANNVFSGEFLKTISGTGDDKPIKFFPSSTYRSDIVGGTVSIKAGQDKAYKLFCEIAKQIKAPEWKVYYMYFMDPKTGKPELPAALNTAEVVFLNNAKAIQIK